MKRLAILATLFFAIALSSSAQRIWGNPVGPYPYSPAGANVNDLGEIVATYYRNYASANNAPQGALLMGSTSLPYDNMGAGFRFDYETGGVLKNVMAEATYVYKINLGNNHKLGLGLSGTYNQTSIDNTALNPQHHYDPFLIFAADGDQWFDVNVGVSFYKTNHYYFGLGFYNLVGNSTTWKIQGFDGRTARQGVASGMYTLHTLNGDLNFEATGHLMLYFPQDSSLTPVYDINLRAIMRKVVWLGGGYTNNMVKATGGIYFQNLAVGYSCGFGIGDITDYAYLCPRHELMCRLELNTSKKSKTKR